MLSISITERVSSQLLPLSAKCSATLTLQYILTVAIEQQVVETHCGIITFFLILSINASSAFRRSKQLTFPQNTCVCRYLYQHHYNLSLPQLIDAIATPAVKKSMEEWSYRDLDTWPTPPQYAHMLGTGLLIATPSAESTSKKGDDSDGGHGF